MKRLKLNILSERNHRHFADYIGNLSKWDYLAVIHCGKPIPEYLKRLGPLIKYSDSICTIYTTKGISSFIPEDVDERNKAGY